jgi:capsular polysaccharide biosynthesis protein
MSDSPAGEISINTAADEASFFETAQLFPDSRELVLGSALQNHEAARGFIALGVTQAVRNFRLGNVVLDADSGLLFKDGHAIPETSYYISADHFHGVRVNEGALIRLNDSEHLIMGYNRAWRNYQHWLTQCLPSIDWSLRQQRHEGIRLILPPLEPWQEEMLAWLGYGSIPRLQPADGRQYLLPHVEYSQFLNGSTSFGICQSLWSTARRLVVAVGPSTTRHDVIYVPCTAPYYGRIANETEIIGLLQSHGVYILRRDQLTTAERIRLFNQAAVVVGPLGADLSDVLFCQAGTLLWEWMPRRYQNHAYCVLAQTSRMDYWGDLFEDAPTADNPGGWLIDRDVVAERLATIAQRAARARPVSIDSPVPVSDGRTSMSLDDLLLKFESLGDNCTFGLVQRRAGAEPLGLLRFAGMQVTHGDRVELLAAALEKGFDGLGSPETISVELDGGVGSSREFVIRDSVYQLVYHTFLNPELIDAEALRQREVRRLGFLRRKLLDDLAAGEKIWVWTSPDTTRQDQLLPLLRVLRRRGPNRLLWVVAADEAHPPGTIEQIDRDFIKGRIAWLSSYNAAGDFHAPSWMEVCQRAYAAFQRDETPASATTPRALTAMEYLASQPAMPRPPPAPVPFSERLRSWLRRRFGRR